MNRSRISSSFRDPSGYVFAEEDRIRRVINPIYFAQYKALSDSGFFKKLSDAGRLIPHTEISQSPEQIIIEPEHIDFISYPYEWSFLQYKHAALLTLKIQIECLHNNFTLKDASAFNVTFHHGRPIFIDTLSFDFYVENTPWTAYKQFVMHFLGPLVLSSYYGPHFLKTLLSDLDGIELTKLSPLLPLRSWLSPTIVTNIHLLAKYDARFTELNSAKPKGISKNSQLKLLQSLYDFIKELKIGSKTEWDNYYKQINYSDAAFEVKKTLTKKWFSELEKPSLIDIGGNDGTFSRLLSADLAIVADIDPNAVEQNYRQVIKNKEQNILPMVADILNPAAGVGFNNIERFPFTKRVQDLKLSGCLALAVIHHITLSGNIPFDLSAAYFAKLAPNLLIEFPTRDDSWVTFLLDSKRGFRDHFDFYSETEFERAYEHYFTITDRYSIPGTARILYTMKRNQETK